MLLQHNEAPFGIVDHDLYGFDAAIFRFEEFAADECMRGIFRNVSARTGLVYPQTHFLFLNTPALRERYGRLLAPFKSSTEIRRLLPHTPQVEHLVQTTDRMVEKLSVR
jgi:hypothetical protein